MIISNLWFWNLLDMFKEQFKLTVQMRVDWDRGERTKRAVCGLHSKIRIIWSISNNCEGIKNVCINTREYLAAAGLIGLVASILYFLGKLESSISSIMCLSLLARWCRQLCGLRCAVHCLIALFSSLAAFFPFFDFRMIFFKIVMFLQNQNSRNLGILRMWKSSKFNLGRGTLKKWGHLGYL